MKKFITLLQILFLCVFLGCGVYIVKSMHDKNATEEEFEELQGLVRDFGDTPFEDASDNAASNPVSENKNNKSENETDSGEQDNKNKMPTPQPEQYEANGMLSRYYQLYEKNKDIVGWIKISDTNIDYPVMYNEDSNAYYLHRNFYKEESTAGIPYLDYQCTLDGTSDNLIIYGHNMRNGTMFHDLLDYDEKSYWQSHRYIGFDTMYNRCRYEVFAVFRTRVGSKNEFKYYDFTKAETQEEYDDYVKKCIELSEYSTGIVPQYGDTLLALSTCSYNFTNERFVVAARLIERK